MRQFLFRPVRVCISLCLALLTNNEANTRATVSVIGSLQNIWTVDQNNGRSSETLNAVCNNRFKDQSRISCMRLRGGKVHEFFGEDGKTVANVNDNGEIVGSKIPWIDALIKKAKTVTCPVLAPRMPSFTFYTSQEKPLSRHEKPAFQRKQKLREERRSTLMEQAKAVVTTLPGRPLAALDLRGHARRVAQATALQATDVAHGKFASPPPQPPNHRARKGLLWRLTPTTPKACRSRAAAPQARAGWCAKTRPPPGSRHPAPRLSPAPLSSPLPTRLPPPAPLPRTSHPPPLSPHTRHARGVAGMG